MISSVDFRIGKVPKHLLDDRLNVIVHNRRLSCDLHDLRHLAWSTSAAKDREDIDISSHTLIILVYVILFEV